MAYWEEKFRAILSIYLVLENDAGEVLLLKRMNTGFCDGQYGLPAGHVDGGEQLHDAMVREAKEEVGIDIDRSSLELIHTMHRRCVDHERVDFFFRCTEWNGTVTNTEPHKYSELRWCAYDALPDNVIDYYRQMFDEVQAGNPMSYFGWE